MHVYLIEEQLNGQPTGLVKIGKANAPSRRLLELRIGNPRELVIRSAFRCGELAHEVEKAAHQRLGAHSVSGEWFAVSFKQAHACVSAIIREHNEWSRSRPLGKGGEECWEVTIEAPSTPIASAATLERLPPVFDMNDMQKTLRIDRQYARKVSGRWAESGHVEQIGPKPGVYYNLVVDPKASGRYIKEAVKKLIGRPFIGLGSLSLRYHEWTHRIVMIDDIAVLVEPDDGPLPKMKGVSLVPRSQEWFKTIRPRCKNGYEGFPVAPPEFALVEAIMAGSFDGLWKPHSDDIELPWRGDPADALRRVEEAAVILNADLDRVREFVGWVDDFKSAFRTP